MKYVYSYTKNTFALRRLSRSESPEVQVFENLKKFLSTFSNVVVFCKKYVCPNDGYYSIGENTPKAFHEIANPQFFDMIIITLKNTNTDNNELHASAAMTMQDLLKKINDSKGEYELQEGTPKDFYSLIFQDFFFEEDNSNIQFTSDYRPTKEVAKPYLSSFDLFRNNSYLKNSAAPVIKSSFGLSINTA